MWEKFKKSIKGIYKITIKGKDGYYFDMALLPKEYKKSMPITEEQFNWLHNNYNYDYYVAFLPHKKEFVAFKLLSKCEEFVEVNLIKGEKNELC